MHSIFFGDENTGAQFGINYGPIHLQHGRQETPQQRTDNGVLRSLAFPQMLDRRDNIKPCHTNTCQWILDLDSFKNWKSQSRGLLWIKGKPGAGKSTLMAFLHDNLEESHDGNQGIRLDFFFSARGTELQRTPLGMLRSLLNQIFYHDETVRARVREIYEERCRQYGYGENNWQWTQVRLEQLLADTILISAKRQQVMIFVDALDEAGAESAQYLAGYFHRILARAEEMEAAVQICISCRHYPIMEDARAVEIHVQNHNSDDIAIYIKDALAGMAVGDSLSQAKKEALVEHLIHQAKGVFQWIYLLMPLIKRRINEGESFDHHSWLREIPADLEEVYVYILNNVILERNREQSFLFFQWVCLAERPLTVTEMRYALAAENAQISPTPKAWDNIVGFVESDGHMKQRINVLSGGLAELVSSGDDPETIQVVHQSVNDFFRTKGLKLMSYQIGTTSSVMESETILFRCQAYLYRSCLVYLATAKMAWRMSNNPSTTKSDIVQDPLLAYATVNLFIHAEKAASSRSGVLKNEKDVLQQVIGPWVQIYRILYPYNTGFPEDGTTLLHVAAASDLIDVIEFVLERNDDVAMKDNRGNTALHLAARRDHITAGKILRKRGADCDAKNEAGITPLVEAASRGHLKFIEWLLHEGAMVRVCAMSGDALQAAVLRGYAEVVRMLLDSHADVNAQGGEYGNALQTAAFGGNTEVVRMLLDAHADVNAQGGRYGNALQAAAFVGNTEVVRILLDAHADVNAQGGKYSNALQTAAFGGNTEVVRILLGAHADVNAQGGFYGNALQAAAFGENTEVVRMLLGAHADVNAQGGYYGNALQAAAFGGNTEVVRMLLDAHADVNAQGGEYGNALQAAAFGGNTEVVRILLDAHADVNAQGGYYGNALQAAASRGSTEVVRILLGAHADVNAQGGFYGNALQAAAFGENTEVVRMLLGAHADVNAQGGYYGNALQAAASEGRTEVVRMLLDAHADVNTQGGKYRSPLHAALHMGHSDHIDLLLIAGADPLLPDELALHVSPRFLTTGISYYEPLSMSPSTEGISRLLSHSSTSVQILLFWTVMGEISWTG
ncbi:hypothetical protein N7532_001717 [Penicillium argentinense]|uniref:protein S-acyltransferase n=1 Tax=Penicillium argentinense TaxID=1131581 RepID=A0A9W9KMS4_9EURO|nr:uncharacterized protein N7532_001717 [Penicillium argentinense]KAJ5111182.1 hypothetical protein N7532_001717 [Penicillium argentinense]